MALLTEEIVKAQFKNTFDTRPSTEVARPRENALVAPIRSLYVAKITARKYFDQDGLHRLAESLKRNGFQKAIAVRYVPGDRDFETYQIITGERLFRGAQIAGIEEIPIDVYDINDGERLLRALTDNVSAEALTLEEEVETVGHLRSVENISHSEINRSIGRGRDNKSGALGSWSENRWRIFRAPERVKSLLNHRQDIIGHVEAIMRPYVQQHEDLQNRLIRMTRNNASVSDLNSAIEAHRAQQQRLQVLPPVQPAPMPTTQGTVPASNYATTRIEAPHPEAPRTAPEITTRTVPDVMLQDRTGAIETDLRATGTAAPTAPQETLPADPVPELLANAIDALQVLAVTYQDAELSARPALSSHIAQALKAFAYKIEHGEK